MRLSTAWTGLVLAAAMATLSAPAGAQTSAAKVSDPIVVHPVVTGTPTKKHSGTWMKAEFLHADNNSMVVSEQGNERMIHTFTYNPQVKAKMQQIINAGGYQYGDKIKIKYTPGTTVALKIHGKPSKAAL
jgi:hypothetical protein